MNYKWIIDLYGKQGSLKDKDRSFCVSFYWGVNNISDRLTENSLYSLSKRYGLDIEEGRYIYNIGKEEIQKIDDLKFYQELK